MMKLADDMRRAGQPFPARLSQSQLGDPNRKRLNQNEAIGELVMKTLGTVDVKDMEVALQLLRQAEAEQKDWKRRR